MYYDCDPDPNDSSGFQLIMGICLGAFVFAEPAQHWAGCEPIPADEIGGYWDIDEQLGSPPPGVYAYFPYYRFGNVGWRSNGQIGHADIWDAFEVSNASWTGNGDWTPSDTLVFWLWCDEPTTNPICAEGLWLAVYVPSVIGSSWHSVTLTPNGLGLATWVEQIPNDPGLIGYSRYGQGLLWRDSEQRFIGTTKAVVETFYD